jgi:hypothetical protein
MRKSVVGLVAMVLVGAVWTAAPGEAIDRAQVQAMKEEARMARAEMQAAPTAPKAEKAILVRCDRGESVQAALDKNPGPVTIEVQGICAENLSIARDNVTLRGVGGALFDGSNLPTLGHGIVVTGATNVTIENLTIQEMSAGMVLEAGAVAALSGVVLQHNRNGLFLSHGSAAKLTRCSVLENLYDGIGAWNGSDVLLAGIVSSNSNGMAGIILSGSTLSLAKDTSVEARANGYGIALQFGASGFFHGMNATVNVDDNLSWGVFADSSSSIVVKDLECSGNTTGVQVDNAYIWFAGGAISGNDLDVVLSFGARADFYGPVTVGDVYCEPSVLTRGVVSCPPPGEKALSDTDRRLDGLSTLHDRPFEPMDGFEPEASSWSN